jgi:hypothetical protein
MKLWVSVVVGAGVLGAVAAPSMAEPVLYTFGATSGSMMINLAGQGSTGAELAGTFAATMYQSNGHVGASDTFMLENSYLGNTNTMKLSLAGLATYTWQPGSLRFLDFAPAGAGHIPPGGGPIQVPADAYVEASCFVTGLQPPNYLFITRTWARSLLPFQMSFSTFGMRSDVVYAQLGGTWGYAVGISDIGLTITIDYVLGVEGTAHVVPDPALGGVATLGLCGAGAWLRRRR